MKNIFILLLICFNFILFAQEKITDVSPDGKETVTYNSVPEASGQKLNALVPFGTAPDWQSTLDRQVGGMVFADYDNDGDLDLAVGNYFSNSYPPINEYETQIYRNDNGVLTTTPAWVSTDMRSTTDVRWADINNDGYIDLLAANGNQSLVPSVIYFNSSSGLETTPSWISSDQNWTVGAAFADVDGDRDLDLIFANQGETNIPTRPVNIFYNNNGILPTTPGYSSADQMISNSVAMADINNNDLTSESILFTANGNGGVYQLDFVPFYSVDTVYVNGTPTNNFCYDAISGWVSLGNIPAAGSNVKIVYSYMPKADMGVCKWVNYQSGIYFNNNGVMSTTPGWTVGNTQSQKGMAWADYNKDGYLDLAIGASGQSTVLYKNNNGVMENSPVWSSTSTTTSTQDLIWGDVNKDGYPDLVLVHFGSRRVEIFVNNAGTLETEPSWTYNPASSSTAIAFGDVNGDGWLDLAVGTARAPVMLFLADPSIIPVELKSFTAEVNNNYVQLNWSTATETNNKGFQVERAVKNYQLENKNFEKIGFVNGNGTSTELNHYSFKDENLSAGSYIYRLKQIDFDGTVTFSKEVEVDFSTPNNFVLEQNFPNPFNPSTKIKFVTPSEGNVSLTVYDMLGSKVSSQMMNNLTAGNHEINFNADGLSSGIYFYSMNFIDVNGKFYSSTKKMIITK